MWKAREQRTWWVIYTDCDRVDEGSSRHVLGGPGELPWWLVMPFWLFSSGFRSSEHWFSTQAHRFLPSSPESPHRNSRHTHGSSCAIFWHLTHTLIGCRLFEVPVSAETCSWQFYHFFLASAIFCVLFRSKEPAPHRTSFHCLESCTHGSS
jgi:hypothetical protein